MVASKADAGKVFAALIGLFLLAILEARLLLKGGALWGIFAATVPILVLAFSRLGSWWFAFGSVAVFCGLVLAIRALLLSPTFGWFAVVGVGLSLLAVVLAVRVLQSMRKPAP